MCYKVIEEYLKEKTMKLPVLKYHIMFKITQVIFHPHSYEFS